MTTAISRLFIVEAKVVFTRGDPDEPLDRTLRSAADAIGEVFGAPFKPKGTRSVRFLSGEGTAGRIELEHPEFTRDAGRGNSWLSLSVERHRDPESGLLFVGIHMGRPEEQIDVEWDAGLQIMPRLVERLKPRLAHMNGRLVDLERAAFPREGWVGASSLPKSFTPWTYFEAASLDAGVRKRLEALPVPRSSAFHDGWLVRAVTRLQDTPAPGLESALAKVAAEPIRYFRPLLSAGA